MTAPLRGIAVALALAYLIFLFTLQWLTLPQAILLGFVSLLVILWTNEALPLGVVSLMPIIFLPAFDLVDIHKTTANYANPIIYLFLGGFMLAIATEKTGLHKLLAKKLLRLFPSTPKGIIAALSISASSLSMLLSNTTTTLLLLPVALSLSNDRFLRVRFLLAVAFGASIGGITTPIGSPPNLILLGFLEKTGMPPIGFAAWIAMMLPLTLLMLYLMITLLSLGSKEHPIDQESFGDIHPSSASKRLTFLLMALVLLLFVNSPIRPFYAGLGWNENLILLSFGLLMFLPKIGFLEWSDSKKIPYEIMFLFGAGFSIATAFSETGLAITLARGLGNLDELPLVLLLFAIALCVIFATELLSNTALISLILPVLYVGIQTLSAAEDKELIMLVATICTSYAFMLPIATPPNAIAIASGGVRVAEMARFGFLLNLAGILSITLVALLYWRLFL